MNKLLPILLLVLLAGCGNEKSKSSARTQNVYSIYKANSIDVKVYYEEGAEPYIDGVTIGKVVLSLKLWQILDDNLNALFRGKERKPQIYVPKDLNEMTQIPKSEKTRWSIEDVLELSRKHTSSSTHGTSTFHIYFLNGYAAEDMGIIGFHISNTKVMAIFKDVIRGVSSEEDVKKYVEQATIVHELGHAFGLVNNGLPMVENHHDKEHKAHCSNKNCVMYYMNEGSSNMISFIMNSVILNQDLVMFDKQCLQDAQNYQK